MRRSVALAVALLGLVATASATSLEQPLEDNDIIRSIEDVPLGDDFHGIVSKSAKLGSYDDDAPKKASSTIVLHSSSSQALQHAKAASAVSNAAKLLLEKHHTETHTVRVSHDGPRTYITMSGLSDDATGKPHSAQLNAALAHVHKYATTCDSNHIRAAPVAVTAFLQHDAMASLLCASGSHRVKSTLLLGYAFADLNMDHDAARRSLQAVAPDAVVHSRDLHPPVFSNPLLAYARKTKAVHTVQTDSGFRSRYRLAVAKAHPALGNFSLAYDVELDERTVILDDEHDIMSVTCDEQGMRVLALHPQPRLQVGSFVQGSAEWGCVQHPSWGSESHRSSSDLVGVSSFVVAVQSVSRSVHASGSITYALGVKAVPMFSAARQWNYMFEAHPPSDQDAAAQRQRQLELACTSSSHGGVTFELEAFAHFDCTDNGLFGAWEFNYNEQDRAAQESPLYPIEGENSLYFRNTYAFFNTYIRLVLIFYVDTASFDAGLRRFEVTVGAQAEVNVELDADGTIESSGTGEEWTQLTGPLEVGSTTFWAGPLPVHVSADISLVGRAVADFDALEASAGAFASSGFTLGVRYENMLTSPADSACYCLGGCSAGADDAPWCNVSPHCSEGQTHDDEDLYWAWCGHYNQQTPAQGLGWTHIKTGDWEFNVYPTVVNSVTSELASGSEYVELQVGAKATVWLYGLIPFEAVPFSGVKVSLIPAPGSGQATCPLGTSKAGLLVQTGLLQMEGRIGDIQIDFDVFGHDVGKLFLAKGLDLFTLPVHSYSPGDTISICAKPVGYVPAPTPSNTPMPTPTCTGTPTPTISAVSPSSSGTGKDSGTGNGSGTGSGSDQPISQTPSTHASSGRSHSLAIGLGAAAGGVVCVALAIVAFIIAKRRREAGGSRHTSSSAKALPSTVSTEVVNPLP